MIDINEGKTNNYLVHGVFVMFGVFICIGLSFAFTQLLLIGAGILFVLAVFLFTASNGLEIDTMKGYYRKYGKIGPYKFGKWHEPIDLVSAKLVLHASNASKGTSPMMGKVATLDSKAITYDIVFVDTFEESHLIYDFLDYKVAKKALAAIDEAYDIPVVNIVDQQLEKNRRKRR